MQKLLFIALSGLVGCFGDDTKITNGTPVEVYKDNSMALLTLLSLNGLSIGRCSGTIIDKYNVMTACHCIQEATTVTVRIGTVRADLLGGGKEYVVLKSQTLCHPNFNDSTAENDIGILKILLGMDLEGSHAKAIELPAQGEAVTPNFRVDLYGWGQTGDDEPASDILLTVNVPVVENSVCNNMYEPDNMTVTDKMMCAGDVKQEGAKGACFGDSGGPAMLENTNKQLGIVSFGKDCKGSAPAVYTRVSAYTTWTLSNKYLPPLVLPEIGK